ncbi:MAG: lysine 5,6-aminomutase subunit alpha TIM-barrel domain-containing protein [Candidatus Limnocylindrales bacterium]
MQRDLAGSSVEALGEQAAAIAAAWSAGARASTTVGQERAALRLLGVSGVDRDGRPLAASVLDRYLAPDARRLGGGITLPIAVAMAEYDLPILEVALEVAAGNIDLGLEAELLEDPERRARAQQSASAMATAALARADANRTARRELVALLGEPRRPLLGVTLESPAIVDAADEAVAAIAAGAGAIRVLVPPSRELADLSARSGTHVEPWHPAPGSRGGLANFDPAGSPVPTGAHRALSVLRAVLDDAGARNGRYVRLVTESPALAAPDQAVIAAFERVDLVIADPLREIVSGLVDPDRALADHAFAHRLLARGGTRVLVPASSLVVASDNANGFPSDPATRSGRALALQLLAVSLALADGLLPDSVVVGALPAWLGEEPSAPARAVAEVAMRRELFPSHRIAFLEPTSAPVNEWHALVAGVLPDAGDVKLLLCCGSADFAARAAALRAAVDVADAIALSRSRPVLTGLAAEHREATLAVAAETLEGLADRGWRWLVDEPFGMPTVRIGAEAVADRTSDFDVLAPGTARG